MTHRQLPLVLFCGGGSGGHLTPGLAVADELQRGDAPPEILFLTGDRPVERRMMAAEPFPHRAFPLGSLRRTVTSLPAARGFAGTFRAARDAASGRPAVAVGTGGYASVPGVLGAKSAGAAVVLLEVNAVPGRATRALRSLAEAIVSDVPVRLPASLPAEERRSLLILGGSQGAASLDAAVPAAAAALREELRGWTVRHQCGTDAATIAAAYGAAGVTAEVAPFFPNAASRLAAATLAIVRGGAVTLAEAEALGAPIVVVPHPRAPDDHQTANARRLAERSDRCRVVTDDGRLAESLAKALHPWLTAPPPRRPAPGSTAAADAAALIRAELRRLSG
ncbi:UDP-N-acetylglucosamine--N-acetylmuramyl-(pentapeptide) pyrophosphoryl-undecaprenol N-acetylglucosamine transferase [Alienimonas californiensis]|uniref:UDP-N-acetylglucosamine--N-acetylmuramyl-(Pentapeptide) pyrophosphoryl-undecaprenol N-acetylglucosamine transferase MurG n=1 Tax=Alienimonas californiensis TaxID=2527989 RepID=A0A517P9M1_9PLAN|nr:UDP-N-acetylglucosamine--N-acetylmuramyl-(pentapeptide) pyrophosphoryl-undecaprenol N-acetylglucosamine transferase [Alienimonas californiensis]QDT16076.1 UDP-N-acetylglucosamine--N-acetylmuramyl-(pentapeptide) pyrophosphoryl-undecaprenol N-acetylglucosamine transferase MurG [Alienimonas californiensis]